MKKNRRSSSVDSVESLAYCTAACSHRVEATGIQRAPQKMKMTPFLTLLPAARLEKVSAHFSVFELRISRNLRVSGVTVSKKNFTHRKVAEIKHNYTIKHTQKKMMIMMITITTLTIKAAIINDINIHILHV